MSERTVLTSNTIWLLVHITIPQAVDWITAFSDRQDYVLAII